jgi:hypothetical protein
MTKYLQRCFLKDVISSLKSLVIVALEIQNLNIKKIIRFECSMLCVAFGSAGLRLRVQLRLELRPNS